MGSPNEVTDEQAPEFNLLANNTFKAFADYDASPTKAWIIENRHEDWVVPYYNFAFGKRPYEELYKLSEDPFQVNNLAKDPAFEKVRQDMNERLLAELRRTGDPRVTGDGKTFERSPYID